MDSDPPSIRRSTLGAYIEPIGWLVLAVAGLILTLGFEPPRPIFELGPAFWPRVVLVGMIIAAGVLAISIYSIGGKQGAVSVAPANFEPPADVAVEFSPRLVAIVVLPLVYVYAMHKLGFLLVTPVFLPAFMYLLGVRRWRTLVLTTVGFYAAIVLLFVKLIFTPLPQGAGFFHSLNGQLIGLIQ